MRARAGRPMVRVVMHAGVGVVAALTVVAGVRAATSTASPGPVRLASGQAAGGPGHAGASRPAPRAPEGLSLAARRGNHPQRVSRSNVGATHSPKLLHQFGGQRRNPPPPIGHALRGVDVAAYQHPHGAGIDWQSVAHTGIQFAAVKATEGTYYKNPYALGDLARARAAGLSVMAYAFAVPNGNGGASSPAAQANYLVNYLSSAGGRLPPIMLDIEYNPYGAECYGLSPAAMVSWITGFSNAIQARTGEDPVVYGPVPWWQQCTGGASRFRQSPLWVPDYTSAPRPELTSGWKNWAFWQYSSRGVVTGIPTRGNTDLDLLNPGVIPLLDSGSQTVAAGDPVDLHVESADPVAGQTLSFSATGLPAGATIDGAGHVTGAPQLAGRYTATVRATGRGGRSGSVSFPWTVKGSGPAAGPAGTVELGRTGMCLTAGPGQADVVISACNGQPGQAWTLPPGPMTSQISGLCLSDGGGQAVNLQGCDGMAAQSWLGEPDGTVRVDGQCLDVPGSATAAGSPVVLRSCDGTSAQLWNLTRTSGG